jgi:calcineurin-like phosphoesterase family protein
MATWVIGDIHGCALELERLLQRLRLTPSDRLVAVGDLFHRGPEPAGVLDLLQRHCVSFVLGNHELKVLRRAGVAPRAVNAPRPVFRDEFPELETCDLDGDGGVECEVPPERRADVLRFLQGHSGFILKHDQIAGAAPTRDGRAWAVVHAGCIPGRALEANTIEDLTSVRRLATAGQPWWYESWTGPELVLFGHTPSPSPRAQRIGERLVALGLDTGCVYGGSLSAYSPELDELVSVKAAPLRARRVT